MDPIKLSLAIVCFVSIALLLPSHAQDSPQDFLDAHNAARAEVGVGPMTWDDILASYAEDYANKSHADCKLVRAGGPSGENLAWGSADLSGTEAVELWVSEKANYDSKNNSCSSGMVCWHYTQVIWSDTVRLGCAKVRCNNGGTFITCYYYPHGNIPGQYPIKNNKSTILAVTPSTSPEADPIAPKERKRKTRLMVGVGLSSIIAGVCVLILALCSIWLCKRRKMGRQKEKNDPLVNFSFGNEFENGMGPRMFSYIELAKATNNFAEKEKLGEGGFGAVYRGFLSDYDVYVAVKRVSRRSKQGIKEYVSEVKIISRLRHKNLVKLIGWCYEKELILAYEFMPNGSLDSHLFKGKSLLTWAVRYKIVLGLASAVLYLHEEGDHCVLHRDIKSSNIMLDSSFNAKLGDFGLARLVDHEKGSQTTVVAGTMGYMAPECLTSGKASKESDVYSFGMVAMEIACGRRPIEPRYEEARVSLVPWVWKSYENQTLLDVTDKKLSMDFDTEQMKLLVMVGLWCVHPDHNLRPSIRQAIQVLNFEAPLPILPSKMPIARYDVSTGSTISSSNSFLSSSGVTIPR